MVPQAVQAGLQAAEQDSASAPRAGLLWGYGGAANELPATLTGLWRTCCSPPGTQGLRLLPGLSSGRGGPTTSLGQIHRD